MTTPLLHPSNQMVMTQGIIRWTGAGATEEERLARARLIRRSIARHAIGDDGNTDAEDKAANAAPSQHGDRVLSV